MLNTLPGTLSKVAHDLIINNFQELLNIQQQKGRISDNDYERLGFPKDRYLDGTEFARNSDYAPRMRSFDMSHKFYVDYQKNVLEDLRRTTFEKQMLAYNRSIKVLESSKRCEESLFENMRRDGIAMDVSSQAELKYFAATNCTAEKLKHFIMARTWKDIITTSSHFDQFGTGNKFPNRMKLPNATMGTDCLILRAFKVRLLPIIFTSPYMPNESTCMEVPDTTTHCPVVHRL